MSIFFHIGYVNAQGDTVDSIACKHQPDPKFFHALLDEWLNGIKHSGNSHDEEVTDFHLNICKEHDEHKRRS